MPRRATCLIARAMDSNRQVTVMDGSMGRQLCIEGLPSGELFHKIWAASALADPSHHELIVSVVNVRDKRIFVRGKLDLVILSMLYGKRGHHIGC